MNLLFCDSFDHYATAQVAFKWTSVLSLTGGTLSIAAVGRNGTNGLSLNRNDAGLRKILPASKATLYIGSGFKFASQNNAGGQYVFAFEDALSEQVSVRLMTNFKLAFFRGATQVAVGSTVLSAGVYYYIEFMTTINNVTGAYEVRINGVTELVASGVNTRTTANNSADSVRLGLQTNAGDASFVYDDLYVCDSLGGVNDGFLGDVRVQALVPNGAGATTQFTPSAGANWQNVDESTPNDDTDYNSDATPGDIDLYTFTDLTPTSGSVKGIQVCLWARKDDAGVRTIAPMVRDSAVNYVGPSHNIGTTYTYYMDPYDKNPGTAAAFTFAELNTNDQFGVKLVA